MWHRLLRFIAIVSLTLLAVATALTLVALRSLAPREGEWSHTLRLAVAGRTIEREIGIAMLLRVASHPLAAPLLDGRTLHTSHGPWLLAALPDGGLRAQCAPCEASLPALGPQPLAVARATLTLAADGADRYHGTLTLGNSPHVVALHWRARFERDGSLVVDARLPRTAIADAVHVLGRDMPERDQVRVRGTVALTASARPPVASAPTPASPR
jgi:hypothetical protein